MNRYFKAAISHWEAQRDEAVATLELYFNKSVGIGEHSNLLKEINQWTDKLSQAEENILNLKTYFDPDGEVHSGATVKQLLNE